MQNTITEMTKKFKFLNDPELRVDGFLTALIVLVAIASFGLGRLSRLEEKQSSVLTEYPDSRRVAADSPESVLLRRGVENESAAEAPSDGLVVTSKNGTRYHFPWCPGAKQIADANKIWFYSAAAAREAGYTPATNCKGLK